jgi:hypothetical protein
MKISKAFSTLILLIIVVIACKQKADFKIYPIDPEVSFSIPSGNDTLAVIKNFILEGKFPIKDSSNIFYQLKKFCDSLEHQSPYNYREATYVFYKTSNHLNKSFKESHNNLLGDADDRLVYFTFQKHVLTSKVVYEDGRVLYSQLYQ